MATQTTEAARQPASPSWKQLLDMPREQAAALLAEEPRSMDRLRSDIEKLDRSDVDAAIAVLGEIREVDPQRFTSGSAPDRGLAQLRLDLLQRQVPDIGETAMPSAAQKSGVKPPEDEAGDGPATPADIGPLADALGKAVLLEDLVGLQLKSGGAYFSDTVQRTLNAAADMPDYVTDDGVGVITPKAYLRAAYLDGGTTTGEAKNLTAHQFLRSWLDGRWREALSVTLALEPDTDAPTRASTSAVAAPLTDMLAAAARVVQATLSRQKRVDARHVLAAYLLDKAGLQAFLDHGMEAGEPPAEFFRELRDAYLAHIARQATKAERKQAWQSVFAPLDDDGHFEGLRPYRPVTVHYPDYLSDTPGSLADDQLDVAGDARALADLICLKDANPPLAIGLFGDWGAGKSTFMQMIEEAVDENTAKVAEARTAGDGKDIPFVERVVHIRFNAWHYLDANLWASLVAHIFRELHRLSRTRRGVDWLDETKVDALIERLEVVRTVEKEAREELAQIERSIESARTRLKQLEEDKVETRKGLFGEYAVTLADAVSQPVRQQLDASVQALGLSNAVASSSQLAELAEEARTFGGRLRLVATTAAKDSLDARQWMLAGLVAFVLLGGLSALAVWAAQSEAVKVFVAQIGFVASVLGGTAAWLLPHLKNINTTLAPLFDAHATVLEKQEEKQRELAAKKAAAQEQLDRLNAEQANKERELEANLVERERLEEIARGDRPTELLARFIEDRATAEGYRKHLGLLSHIRRDFENMSELMRKQRRMAEANQPEDTELPRIDRIVLYIDDLDRCRDKQVVEVLEAIHLLLAFDLFVVVVGVDARWLQHSLGKVYEEQLAVNGSGENGMASVADYLEKIFQVPFHLSPLRFGENGSYGRLVDKLVGEVTTRNAGAQDDRAAQPGRENNGADENGAGAGKGDRGGKAQALRTLDVAVPEREETAEETLQRVVLSAEELAAIKELGPLVGRSPRTVKRFVNLYRLMRTRRRGGALDAFLSEPDGGVAPYKVYLLWLALETALTPAQISSLLAVLVSADQKVFLTHLFDDLEPIELLVDGPGSEDILARNLREFWLTIEDPVIRNAFSTGIFATGEATVAELRAVIDEASRYTFRMRGTA